MQAGGVSLSRSKNRTKCEKIRHAIAKNRKTQSVRPIKGTTIFAKVVPKTKRKEENVCRLQECARTFDTKRRVLRIVNVGSFGFPTVARGEILYTPIARTPMIISVAPLSARLTGITKGAFNEKARNTNRKKSL